MGAYNIFMSILKCCLVWELVDELQEGCSSHFTLLRETEIYFSTFFGLRSRTTMSYCTVFT